MPAFAHLLLMAIAGTAAAQFNTSFEFAFKPTSPSFDMTKAGRKVWIVDDKTGYVSLSPEYGSSGGFNSSFIGTGLRLYGEADAKLREDREEPHRAMTVLIANGPTIPVNTSSGARLLAESVSAEARFFKMKVGHPPGVALTFHNVTVDVPVRTQA